MMRLTGLPPIAAFVAILVTRSMISCMDDSHDNHLIPPVKPVKQQPLFCERHFDVSYAVDFQQWHDDLF